MSNIALVKDRITLGPVPRPLSTIWQHRGLGMAVALGVTALAGLFVSFTMPRGPATAAQALTIMVTGLIVGLVAGLASRSRWAMVLAPIAYIVTIEIGQLDVVGPTVGAIRLDNTFGILALILGRGFHGLVALLPMILGVEWGVQWSRWLSDNTGQSRGRLRMIARKTVTAAITLFLIALAILIAIPASTPPILNQDGEPVPGSIAELATVNIGGHDQAIMIRGYDVNKPILLYLSGGPGQSSLPYARVMFGDLTRDFILVGWDQRGTGKSYAALDPTSTLTLDQAVSDTIELTNYLRDRFDEDKIYLLGESWGTTLGVLAAQQRPDLYHAFIGSGQMVSQRETDQRLYYDLIEYAAHRGDMMLAADILAYGEPPYADVPYAYGFVMGYYDALYKPYTPPQAYVERGEGAGLGPWGVLGSEYNLVEKINVLRGLIDMFTVLYPQLQEIDFRQDVTRLEVPVYILDGQAELSSRRDLALEWLDQLEAPQKDIFSFENAGHAPAFEHFEAFHEILTNTILPETYG